MENHSIHEYQGSHCCVHIIPVASCQDGTGRLKTGERSPSRYPVGGAKEDSAYQMRPFQTTMIWCSSVNNKVIMA